MELKKQTFRNVVGEQDVSIPPLDQISGSTTPRSLEGSSSSGLGRFLSDRRNSVPETPFEPTASRS